MSDEKKECSCVLCVKACQTQPGWLAPGEAEKVAEYLGVPFEQFATDHLIKDSASNWSVYNAPYVWAPRKVWLNGQVEVGETRDRMQQELQARCIFLKDERCTIHAVKPYECRKVFACKSRSWFGSTERDDLENLWLDAGAPLGMRPDPGEEE